MEDWQQTLGAGPLLAIAAGAVALILFMVIVLKLHAFLTMIIVSALTAFATGIPADEVVGVLTEGFGKTLASVALLVGLGAMLGRLVEVSGGAQSLADALVHRFGEKRAPMALGIASLIMGFPIFFDAGLVVMLPVIFAVARRLNGSILTYAIPSIVAFSCMHVFLPPHPGPIAASEFFGADIGLIILLGLIVAIPTWYLSGVLFGRYLGRKYLLPVPDILSGGPKEESPQNPAKPGTVVCMLLLPILLIFMNTGMQMAVSAGWTSGDSSWASIFSVLGATPIALLISTVVATYVLGIRRNVSREAIDRTLESSLGPICSVVLITGAGGMFGGVLRTSGIGDALSDSMKSMGIPVLLACFLISVALRLAQGSATVALTTAAALMAPSVLASGYSELQLALLVLAVAAGSIFGSLVNDSGFWLVGRLLNLDVQTTLKTWTISQVLVASIGFGVVCILWAITVLIA